MLETGGGEEDNWAIREAENDGDAEGAAWKGSEADEYGEKG